MLPDLLARLAQHNTHQNLLCPVLITKGGICTIMQCGRDNSHFTVLCTASFPAGLFVSLYAAVERLLLYQDGSAPGAGRAASRCILLHEFCPALHTLLEDGLKVGIRTTSVFMYSSVLIKNRLQMTGKAN